MVPLIDQVIDFLTEVLQFWDEIWHFTDQTIKNAQPTNSWWLDKWPVSYGQFLPSPAHCEDSVIDGGHVFWPILLIYNRNVYFSPPRLGAKFGVDTVKIHKRIFILLFVTLCKLAKKF